jgi:hypothetical protein
MKIRDAAHTVGRLASLWYQIGVPREAQRGDNASICALLVAGGHAHGVPDETPAACTNRDELSQAIPPQYTEFIGKLLMAVI